MSTDNFPLPLPSFHKQQDGACCESKQFFSKACLFVRQGQNLIQCQVKKEPINRTNAAGRPFTDSASVWRQPMDVKYWPAAGKKDVINWLFPANTEIKNNPALWINDIGPADKAGLFNFEYWNKNQHIAWVKWKGLKAASPSKLCLKKGSLFPIFRSGFCGCSNQTLHLLCRLAFLWAINILKMQLTETGSKD